MIIINKYLPLVTVRNRELLLVQKRGGEANYLKNPKTKFLFLLKILLLKFHYI